MLVKLFYAAIIILMPSCVPVTQCKVYYLNDGRTPAQNVHPYFKLVRCEGKKDYVECDDERPLPTDKCK